MLEMRDLKPDPQAHLPTSQSLLFVQKIFADVNKEIEAVANTEKKAEKKRVMVIVKGCRHKKIRTP